MNNSKIKEGFKAFFLGISGVLAIAGFMYFISLDLRWVMVIGTIYFSGLGFFTNSEVLNPYVKLTLSLLPPTVFHYLILTEIPDLYFIIPLIIIASLIGYWVRGKNHSLLVKLSAAAAIVLMVVIGYNSIPHLVQQQLVKIVNEPSPDFQFINTDGELISKEDLTGQVVVLDFFGTWCKPCIQELNEIAPLKTQYNEVSFFVISSAQGGDTIEKVAAFAKKRGHGFPFGFDTGGKMHESFGFTGVPALVILDRNGNIRMMHEGYNASEEISQIISEILGQLTKE
jgi:peroxiredoxin